MNDFKQDYKVTKFETLGLMNELKSELVESAEEINEMIADFSVRTGLVTVVYGFTPS